MRRNVSLTVILFVMFLAVAPMATADVPNQMNYQGQLTDDLGAPLDTIVSMTFTIYSDSSGGMVLWTETQTGVEVSGGLFNVLLGSGPPIPDTVFADDWRWLGIQIGSDPEIAPLTKLVTVPYAFRVATVDGSSGGVISGDVSIQSDLDVDGDLWVTGKAKIGWANGNTGAYAFVAGESNSASGDWSAVSGGRSNSAENLSCAIGGGQWNTASDYYGTVSGGSSNTASGFGATVSGGTDNTAGDLLATVGGGDENLASGDRSTVGGGANNTASDGYCTVSGGNENTAGSPWATVGGGNQNTANGGYSTVSGGFHNITDHNHATVGGGYLNTASGIRSTVSGGQYDTASADGSTVGGGMYNVASGYRSTVGGGNRNSCSGDSATIGGGSRNSATGSNSTIGGGTGNEAAFVGVGPPPDQLGGWSTVGGGRDNRAQGDYSTIGGGRDNTAAAGWTAMYGGYSTVAGGQDNHAFAMYSTVSGGQLDSALAPYTTVGGGYMNTAGVGLLANPDSGQGATVAGGYGNRAAGYYSTVAGGESNAASGWHSTVSGGTDNDNAGSYSAIPGGDNGTLTLNAHHSLAFGRDVYVNTAYRVVFFDSVYSGRLGINRDDHNVGGIAHPIHVGTDGTNGNGAHLTAGGSWASTSSRTFKENFQPLDSDLLARISDLPLEAWQYKDTDERHIGPVSEDFVRAFDVGTVNQGVRDDKYLSPGDVAGVALAGVKELIQENQELKQIISDLTERIADLEKTGTSR